MKANTAKKSPSIADPINSLASKESTIRARFTSTEIGRLSLVVQESQGLFYTALTYPIAIHPGTQSDSQKAVVALSAESFRLSRCAHLMVSSGYPLQSLARLYPLRTVRPRSKGLQ